jgi:hypothetical protein
VREEGGEGRRRRAGSGRERGGGYDCEVSEEGEGRRRRAGSGRGREEDGEGRGGEKKREYHDHGHTLCIVLRSSGPPHHL